MAKRRRKKSKRSFGKLFKLLLLFTALALAGYYFYEKKDAQKGSSSTSQKSKKGEVLVSKEKDASKENSKEPSEETKPPSPPEPASLPAIVSSKALTQNFPPQAWLDDYLKVETHLENHLSSNVLIGLGLAPEGKKPDQIRNPEKLKPVLLVLRKQGSEYQKIAEFDFSVHAPAQGNFQGKFTGLPRIKPSMLVDLNGDKRPEILVSLDATGGSWSEAMGLLQWNQGHLEWVKTRDLQGKEKIALWAVGATAAESQKIVVSDIDKDGKKEILQKRGFLDPVHPEKGFVTKNTIWEFKEGVLQERP